MAGLTKATRVLRGNYSSQSLDAPSASRGLTDHGHGIPMGLPAIVVPSQVQSSGNSSLYRLFAEALQDFIEEEFCRLADQWKADTRFVSSYTDMVSDPAYLRIIGMGRQAVPFLLQRLEREPDQWFAALRATANADPVAAADRGRFDRMRAAWLDWGRSEGFLDPSTD